VNQGISMKRFMPMARGQAHRFRHRRASITLVLDAKKDAAAKPAKKTSAKKAAKKAK
jgi:hypothetical protein